MRRFQLEGPSLDALKAQVLAEHGPRARIIAAEKVTVGGIGGFLSRQHYEVTVELPPSGRRRAPVEPDLPSRTDSGRTGISALLEEAERAESNLHPTIIPSVPVDVAPAPAPAPQPAPSVSTGSHAFAELMETLAASTGTPAHAPAPAFAPGLQEKQPPNAGSQVPPSPVGSGWINQGAEPGQRNAVPMAPAPLGGAGDLVMVVGLGDDALEVCSSMADFSGAGAAAVRVAGVLETDGVGRAADRRAVATARAAGVMAGHSIFLAYGLGRSGTEMGRHSTLISALAADQVWVAVDAGRKPEDTASWVGAVRSAVVVDAAAVEGIDTTGTPQSVNALGLPIGWLDGEPSPTPVL
ncbi:MULTISPECIES: hypothetical protein [Arthrobacter]|uniref:Uncharacterized protein n=1 Tax=Arthrobacter jinronghuae TaxID=2964609 RepID=A0ABT1NUA3_9MICC|nr:MULTISPECIES: hypothetical protein [Arthrobacter]MCQ1951166.1 hypothetical protein [Arthrobacter jinronghuae]MCQ1954669.1 hypothetical protein [Arthrobacter sp. zg-Y238]UWX79059.1 hypothetical protein N2K98_02230 [Arthrobacter jinronghuae]